MKSFVPSRTPVCIKILLGAVFSLSVFSFVSAPYLALSLYGIKSLWLWQFVTYLFIHPFPATIIQLVFNLYLIWIFGASLLERLHPRSFLLLFFGSGIFAALGAWITMATFSPSSLLFGSTPAVYGLLITWIMLNPTAEFLLFFSAPFKARHLILALIGVNLLINLSRFQWTSLFADLGAIAFSYFFALASNRQHSPFFFLVRFENKILRLIEFLTQIGKRKMPRAKIFDIKSGEPIWNDEQFMDAMLARISLYGEETLSPQEKKRMQEISAMKSLDKQ